MTYCLAITLKNGIVFASDSRSNAGVDYVTTYSKMHVLRPDEDRFFVLLAAGNLSTTQEVVNRIQRDLDDETTSSLHTIRHLFEAAEYVGALSDAVQRQHADAWQRAGVNGEATFIIGGQVRGEPHGIFLVYPPGNFISASPETPYLQIGESKYGKPILDRIVDADTPLDDAARCALVSLDSTMRSNISVGAPLELAIYQRDSLEMTHYLTLKLASPLFASLQKRWSEGLRAVFKELPRFEWEK